jgi:molecular chaperone GrpE
MEILDHELPTATPGYGAGPVEEIGERAELRREVDRLEAEVASERERRLRALADFDNFRRRVRRERAEAERAELRALLLELLEVMDDFDRARSHLGDSQDAVADGLRLIRQRLDRVLRSNGVEAFESAGSPFDPEVHEAMGTVEGEGHEPGVVAAELRRGYLWNGRLLRPSRVLVAR